MPRDFPRSRRIEEQIQRILSEVIRVRVRDPRVQQAIVTGVDVSRDLSVAWVYVSTLDNDQSPEELEQAVNAAAGFMRGQLAKELTVRSVPELRFRFDDSSRTGPAMESLIDRTIAADRKSHQGSDDERD
jgi:ribosome-binding factor A